MMNRIVIFGFILLFLSGGINGQGKTSVMEFSLQEAVTFALENNLSIKNAELDIEEARKEVWSTTAIGLPQVNGSYDYQHLPGTLPSLSFPDPDGGFQKIALGVKNSATYNVMFSQLVFSGEYIIGLQAARTYLELSSTSRVKSEMDVKEAVHMAYYTVLLMEKNKEILDSSLHNINSVLFETKAMYEQGFIEETDYEQIQVTRNTLINSSKALERQINLAFMLLRIQLGLSAGDEVRLTDKLHSFISIPEEDLLFSEEFDLNRNVDYQLLRTQERISELTLSREKSKYLPSVSAFYLYQDKTRKADFDITFNNIVGLNVSVPIFSSGQRMAKVQQARINLEKARNTREKMSENILMSVEQTRTDFNNAYEKYLIERENLTLAEKVFERTRIKYKQGVSSGMDLTQANNQYLDSYSSYTGAIFELLTARVKFKKALTNL